MIDNVQSFSQDSAQYARHRPQYPDALFVFLRDACPRRERAWDCATGNGQAAVSCARYFERVAATDLSAAQVRHGLPHPRVRYSAASAERAPFRRHAFDLVMVAQAAHWFDLEQFFREVERVLRPGGVLAVWGYGFLDIAPEVNAVLERELLTPIDPFWAQGNRMVMNGYRSLRLPYAPLPPPKALCITLRWNLPQLLAYLRTWSAVKRYRAARGRDPVSALERALAPLWPEAQEEKTVTIPVFLKAARKPAG